MRKRLALFLVLATVACSRATAADEATAFTLYNKQGRVDIPAATMPRVTVSTAYSRPSVLIEVGPREAEQLCSLTSRLIGQNLAIIVGCRVVSNPVVVSPLCGRGLQVLGSFTVADADQLAADIRRGSERCKKLSS